MSKNEKIDDTDLFTKLKKQGKKNTDTMRTIIDKLEEQIK